MAISNLQRLPLFLFLLFPITFCGTYLAAVLQGHVAAEFPYISDVATYSPESCVFGQLMNIGSFMLCIVIYIRYCELWLYTIEFQLKPIFLKLNKIALWFGLLSSLGLSIVANFQETNVKYIHYFGASLCFGCGTVYFWIQAFFSYNLPMVNSLITAHLRVLLSIICTIFFIIQVLTGIIAHSEYHGKNPRKWRPNDGGYTLHIISTGSEWFVAVSFCIYIISFYSEFRKMAFSHPLVIICIYESLMMRHRSLEMHLMM